MTWQSRIIHDGKDRAGWETARSPGIGASDAAKFAKLASVPAYTKSKLRPKSFHGSQYTESGHRWEPMMLAYLGIPENKALIHAPDEVGFTATPDGITPDGSELAEVKAKHNKIVDGPSPGEWRQLAWQFLVVPEANVNHFAWIELVDKSGEWVPRDRGAATLNVQTLTVYRDDPRITERQALLLPIATEVLAAMRAARAFEMEVSNV